MPFDNLPNKLKVPQSTLFFDNIDLPLLVSSYWLVIMTGRGVGVAGSRDPDLRKKHSVALHVYTGYFSSNLTL